MRKFRYDNPTAHGKIDRTEDDILDEYWNYWCEKVMKTGMPKPSFFDQISRDYCIEDWCTENGAWEVIEPPKVINMSNCLCTDVEWYDCDKPCGYKAWEKARK